MILLEISFSMFSLSTEFSTILFGSAGSLFSSCSGIAATAESITLCNTYQGLRKKISWELDCVPNNYH